MPISDFGSYPMTGQEIKSHWENVDADRLAHSLTVLKLPTDYGLPNFSADLTDVQAVLTELEDLENANQIANATRDFQRSAMRDRAVDLRGGVKYRLKDSIFVGALPDTPHENASEQKLLSFLDDMASVWTRINAATNVPGFTPPLLLRNGYSLATFQTEIGNLRAAFAAVKDAEVEWRLGRQRRDELLAAFRDRMVTYRQAIEYEYGPDHMFTQSLPDVYPPESSGGGTPGVPVAPGAPTLTNTGVGQVGVDWTLVAGAQSYNLYKRVMGTNSNFVLVGPAMQGPATLSDLPPGATVHVRLTALNAAGEGPPGPHAEITLPAPPP